MAKQTIKPGILVALSARMEGGIEYKRVELDKQQDGATVIRKWETISTVIDQAEYDAGCKERGRIRGMVSSRCLKTGFGLVCTTDMEAALDKSIEEAHKAVNAWNATAKHNKLTLYVLTGRIAKDDEAASKAIIGEVKDLLGEMKAAVAAADPARIREAASAAKSIGQMLTPDLEEKVSKAVKNVRSIARAITARVEKAGEDAAAVVAECNTAALENCRFAFLDLTGEGYEAPAEPITEAQSIDLDMDSLFAGTEHGPATPAPDAPELDDDDPADEMHALFADAAAPELDE